MIASEARKFQTKFDTIVVEVKKYSANARKFSANARKRIEERDVITILQFKTERKEAFTSRSD